MEHLFRNQEKNRSLWSSGQSLLTLQSSLSYQDNKSKQKASLPFSLNWEIEPIKIKKSSDF